MECVFGPRRSSPGLSGAVRDAIQRMSFFWDGENYRTGSTKVKRMRRQEDFRRPQGMEDAEVVLHLLDSRLAKRFGQFLMNAMDLDLGAIWFRHASQTSKVKRGTFDLKRDALVHAGVAAYRRCCNKGQRS